MAKPKDLLQIRCSKETKKEFKRFILENDFRTYEDGLDYLLKHCVPRRFY